MISDVQGGLRNVAGGGDVRRRLLTTSLEKLKSSALASASPNDKATQRDLSMSFLRLGDLAESKGNLTEAQRLLGEAHSISQRLSESDPANAACVFSLCATAIKAEEGRELAAEQSARRQELLQKSLAALKQSMDKGWTNFAHMQQDPDLTPLHELLEFKALIPNTPSAPMQPSRSAVMSLLRTTVMREAG